jgi:hypothetical protein
MPVVIHDFKVVKADRFPAAIASVSAFCPQQAQNVQGPSDSVGVAPGGSASDTVTAGATTTYALSIGGAGMSGTASLTYTGAPTGAVCSVPATVPLNAASASTFNVSVTTTSRSPTTSYHRGSARWLWVW